MAPRAAALQAYAEGLSRRRFDDPVPALGVDPGIFELEVSRICAGLEADLTAWRTGALGEQPLS